MRLLIAGGGTGGHLFPGLAVAEEVMRRPDGEVLFVGTARGIEARVVPAAGYRLELLDVSGLKRMGVAATARGLLRVPGALARSFAILRAFRPDAVLGVGGYASGPLVLAAALARYPTAIQEQNSVPGVTNRMLGRVARAVFIAFDDAAPSFAARKVALTGNPVRRAFVDAAVPRGPAPAVEAGPGAQAGEPGLLVVGGSQGARAVNDLVIGAAAILARQGALPPVTLQAGAGDHERCRARVSELGVADRIAVQPFIDDMAAAYRQAALVVARAGALTLAELAMVGRAAILVPLPTAADDHQTRNAAAFARAGAAIVVDQKDTPPEALAQTIATLMADGARRAAMAAAMAGLARPDAARDIVDRLQALARGPG